MWFVPLLNVLICLATRYNLKPYQDNFNLNGERLINAPLLVFDKRTAKTTKKYTNIRSFSLYNEIICDIIKGVSGEVYPDFSACSLSGIVSFDEEKKARLLSRQ